MVHTRAVIEYQHPVGVVLPAIAADVRMVERDDHSRLAVEAAVDQILADSFPASDPPGWTPGIARPAGQTVDDQQVEDAIAQPARSINDHIMDVSRGKSSERSFAQPLISLFGAMGLALIVPLAILLIGLPVALVVRGLIEVVGWLLGS